MKCREFTEFIIDYFEGDLAADVRAAFEQHISRCHSCVKYLDTYRETIVLGKTACSPSNEPLLEDVPEDLVRAILAARPPSE